MTPPRPRRQQHSLLVNGRTPGQWSNGTWAERLEEEADGAIVAVLAARKELDRPPRVLRPDLQEVTPPVLGVCM